MEKIYNKIDNAPLFSVEFSADFEQWLSVTIDILNQFFIDLENGISFPHKTQAEIIALGALTDTPNGTGWYCTDSSPPNIVFKINGSLVQLNTSAFP